MSQFEFACQEFTMGQMNALVKTVGKENVLRVLRGEVEFAIKELSFLRKINAVAVSGAKKFVAKDAFKDANVGWTSDNFKELFLDKVEEDVGDAIVAVHRLEKDSLDAPITAQLGSRAEIKLVHFFELLKRQFKGEDGVLLTNGYANIAYIKGNDGIFWAVDAYWCSGGGDWYVRASSVGRPHRWRAGRQVLSCDS